MRSIRLSTVLNIIFCCELLIEFLNSFIESYVATCINVFLSFYCVQSQAEAAIEEVCSKLGPLKDECDSVVQDYFPQIWQLLMSQVVSVRVYVPMVLLV